MIDLIKELIYKLNPAYRRIKIVAVDGGPGADGVNETTMEQILENRLHGDQTPVVIYGYDCLEKLQQRRYGGLLKEEGIFYLQVPACLEEIYPILDTASAYKEGTKQKNNLAVVEHEYAIKKVRSFKHRCDNLWISMQSNLSIQKTEKNNKEQVKTKRLINAPYIEQFSKEYERDIEEIVKKIGLKKADKIPILFSEVIKSANNLWKNERVQITSAILTELTNCVKKIRTISNILSKAKELEEGG